MTDLELRNKIQDLFNNHAIKVSDYVLRGQHYIHMFYAANGNTYHIHSSLNNGLVEEKHREKFYKEAQGIKDKM